MKNLIGAFIGHMIVPKVLVDGAKIPYEQYNTVRPQLDELENWAGIFSGLELDKPSTWMSTARALVRRVAQTSKDDDPVHKRVAFDPFDEALSQIGYHSMNKHWFLADMIWDCVAKSPEKTIFVADDYIVSKISLPDGQYILRKRPRPKYQQPGGAPGKPGWGFGPEDVPVEDPEAPEDLKIPDRPGYAKAGDLYLPSTRSKNKDLFYRAMGRVLYGAPHHTQKTADMFTIDWDANKSGFIVEGLAMPDRPYRGNALDWIEEWDKYLQKGVRRCICLQGKPGTGKSTLTRTAAKKLNRRTVKITSEAFLNIGFTNWNVMIALLDPQVLILDDIDRISSLEDYLDRFEDAYYKVPLTLFTSNHLDEIPSAFKRPGRIDQILELEDPDASVRLQVLQEFSTAEGAGKIPEHRIPFMEALYAQYSGAFAVEYLRRVAVQGWDYKLPQSEITFQALVGKEDELDPRRHPNLLVENELLATLHDTNKEAQELDS